VCSDICPLAKLLVTLLAGIAFVRLQVTLQPTAESEGLVAPLKCAAVICRTKTNIEYLVKAKNKVSSKHNKDRHKHIS